MTLVALTAREVVPLWLVVAVVGRDLLLTVVLAILVMRRVGPLPVHLAGKAGTFALLYAFPLLLLGDGTGTVATIADTLGWAFAFWGIGLYWWAGVLYAYQVWKLLHEEEPSRA